MSTQHKNWNCDGAHCVDPHSEVRVYPLGAGGNLYLCLPCWANENRYRHMMGYHYKRPEDWPQVDWNTAQKHD